MKIKERERSRLFCSLKKDLRLFLRIVFNKKTAIIVFIIILICSLFIGMVLGMFVTGFFGTLDNPSQRAITIAHYIGIENLRDIKSQITSIKSQNIKIPINYIRGKFSKPEKIYIDIGFKDYKTIEYERQQALKNEYLDSSGENYVPAKIRTKDKEVDVKLRLKGDLIDHLEGDKWSFRIKVGGEDSLFGMKTFSIQDPKTRNYVNEFAYHNALKKSGALSIRYDFVEVIINGENKGIYAIEEHFEKELIENNKNREGVIIKFNEDFMWDERLIARDYFEDRTTLFEYINSKELDWFYTSYIETFDNEKILEDPVLPKEFEKARSLLELFRKGSLETSDVFDTDKLSKYLAINTVFGSEHASMAHNIRFYYNPITSRLEPIGYDGEAESYDVLDRYSPYCFSIEENCSGEKIKSWENLIFKDKEFYKKYIRELEVFSEKSYLDGLFLELDSEINQKVHFIWKDNPLYSFSKNIFYMNQERIRDRLSPIKGTSSYFQEKSEDKLILTIGNLGILPIEIVNVVYDDSVIFELAQTDNLLNRRGFEENINYKQFEFKIPSNFNWQNDFSSNLKINYKILGINKINTDEVFPWAYTDENFTDRDFIRKEPNVNSSDILIFNENAKSVSFKKGDWIINESLIIPEGYDVFLEKGTIIDLIEGAMILSYSRINFQGTLNEPIKITSSDKTGQGISILKAQRESNLKNVIFENLKNPSKEGWELSGAINFYESPVKLDSVLIKNMNSEDSINIIRTNFSITNSNIKDCFSDCFDADFSDGIIISSKFNNCGNDCIDVSGAEVEISDLSIIDVGDKGISAGEKSNLKIKNIQISSEKLNKSFIGIASKDNSYIFVENISISDCKYGFAVYQKKPEFGPSSIDAVNINLQNLENDYIIEDRSNLVVNGIILTDKEKKVYDKLYGEVL